MDAVSADARHIHAGDGTCEAAWRSWLHGRALPRVPATQLVQAGQRVVVVAPHPDDEVLMVGGLLSLLADAGRSIALVAVTDGEASHPGSTRWTPAQMAQARARESEAALRWLGARASVTRLGFPDGGVAAQAERLACWLRGLMVPGDLVFTTWSLDGHPDHEATARAVRSAARTTGARVFEVPVWGWHWAAVGESSMPWSRAQLVPLPLPALRRKHAAVQAFATQWQADPTCAQTPVLRPSTLQRAQRPFEVVFA